MRDLCTRHSGIGFTLISPVWCWAVWPPWRIRWSSDRVLARIPFLSHVVTGNAEPITMRKYPPAYFSVKLILAQVTPLPLLEAHEILCRFPLAVWPFITQRELQHLHS